jgi:hypothetical protein
MKPSIIYALIARGTETVLTSCDRSKGGNFPLITLKILKRINNNDKKSYEYRSEYKFHFTKEDDITYLCMADSGFKSEFAHGFLEDIK